MGVRYPGDDDSIVALATAPGRSALAVIRLSGPQALSIAGRIVKPWPIPTRQVAFCRAYDPEDGSAIDQLVVCCFAAPRSYTGENVVEFSIHGGHAVSDAIMAALLKAGAREALPGEFTRRAVLNGKLDLVQAEAIGDLIDASSDSMRRIILHQLDGGLSKQIAALRDGLLRIEALLAYDIDFPEEDDGPISHAQIMDAARAVATTLDTLLETAPTTELLRDGAIVVIAGRPNVGKSSLFNALVGEARAIVTEIPGTTRDAIEARVQVGKWPARLVDTAGLRSTDEVVERLGIEISERYLGNAHAILACDDDANHLENVVALVGSLSSAPVLKILTKCDRPETSLDQISRADSLPHDAIQVSARERTGLTYLAECISGLLEKRCGLIPVSRPALTRTRQRVAVQRARDELGEFMMHWQSGDLPASIAAVHIRQAVTALDELIGTVDVEDILDRVFSTFCVGK